MIEVFSTWGALNKAVNDETTHWGQMVMDGEEVLLYRNPEGQLALSDEPMESPWSPVEL